MSAHYYNDFDPKPCKWLLELGRGNHIPKGYIDARSIADIQPNELNQYTQCHFFAGIGGWPYALRLAGWPEDVPVWTGSCPCQPFSVAGKQRGTADERHLWPQFIRLIAECRPPVIFGEQVTSKLGREWLAGVRADLEALGYEVGAADLCAAGVASPHARPRIFWLAYSNSSRRNSWNYAAKGVGHRHSAISASNTSFWSDFETHQGSDGSLWRVGTRIQPVAARLSGDVDLLRGYGNAIVPQVAAAFIRASVEAINDSQLCVS